MAVGDFTGGLAIYDLDGDSLTPIQTWKGHAKAVRGVIWRGDQLITCSTDKTLAFWDGDTLQSRLDVQTGGLNALALSDDGARLLAVSDDRALWVLDLAEDLLVGRWIGHEAWVTCVDLHPSGQTAVTGSSDANLVVWDLNTGESAVLHGHIDGVTAVSFIGDGQTLVSASKDGVIKVWDTESRSVLKTLRGHEGVITSLATHGTVVASSGADFRVGLWEIDGKRSRHTGWLQGHKRPVNIVAFAQEGTRLVSGGNDRSVGLWNRDDAHPSAIFHAGSVRAVAFSPDGEWLASGSRDQTVWVRDVRQGQRLLRLQGHDGAVQGIAFSPLANRTLASVGTDGMAFLWDLASGSDRRETAL